MEQRIRALSSWTACAPPDVQTIEGQHTRIERVEPARHGKALYQACKGREEDWRYMGYGPFDSESDYLTWLHSLVSSDELIAYAIDAVDLGISGIACFARIEPSHGSIEVGHIYYSPQLQRTKAATEAMYLLMKFVFDAGYRRYEWKCDSDNARSRRAALRLGFKYEGLFRQHRVVKGKNRDTAWFSIMDSEWPKVQRAFQAWLEPSNFDEEGKQKRSLESLRIF